MTTIFRGIRVISVVSLVSGIALVPLFTGCGLLKKKDDAADAAAEAAVAEVAEAAPPPAAAPAAANENDVSRFPDEKKLENVTATIARPTNVREIPGIGKVVASLAKGGTVTEIAQRSTFFLVVFTNPTDQKTLMGWISQDSFTPPAPVVLKAPTCTIPETPLISDTPFCGKVCSTDAECPAGQACKGQAKTFSGAKVGEAVSVCTVFSPAKPVAQPVIIPITPSATAPATPPAATTVAAQPNPPAASVDVTSPAGNKCPVGFRLVITDHQCHRECKGGGVGVCHSPTPLCVSCSGSTVCAATRDCK